MSSLAEVFDPSLSPQPPTVAEEDIRSAQEIPATDATDTTPAIASVFANPRDIARYRMAKAQGASEEEALKVGDNGKGAWGDDTTSHNIPMVALPADTPGLSHGRLVEVQGPAGKVIAKVADKMPATPNLQGKANIDLNPAAASLVGHGGGVMPVKWKWAGEGATHDTVAESVPHMPPQIDPTVIGKGLQHAQLLTDGSAGDEGSTATTAAMPLADPNSDTAETAADAADAADGASPDSSGGGLAGASVSPAALPPPSMKGAKAVSRNDDGTVLLDNGYNYNPKDGSVTYKRGGKLFWSGGPDSTPVDVTPRSARPRTVVGPDGMVHVYDEDPFGKLKDLGVSPQDPNYKSVTDIRKELRQLGTNTDGMSSSQLMDKWNEKQDLLGYVPKGQMKEAMPIISNLIKNTQLKTWAPLRQAKEEVDTGYQQGLKDPGGAGDVALAEGVLRMLNPGVGVRYGMLTNLQSATGMLRQYNPGFMWEKMMNGDKFTQFGRDQLKAIADAHYNTMAQNVQGDVDMGAKALGSIGMRNPQLMMANFIEMHPILSGDGTAMPNQVALNPAGGAATTTAAQPKSTPYDPSAVEAAARKALSLNPDDKMAKEALRLLGKQ